MIRTLQEASQALREAAKDPNIVPVHGPIHRVNAGPNGELGVCAVGAIVYKAGYSPAYKSWTDEMLIHAPVLALKVEQPKTGNWGGTTVYVYDAIVQLYERDGRNWEEIADWLDTAELIQCTDTMSGSELASLAMTFLEPEVEVVQW